MFDNINHSTVSDCWRKCEQWVKKKVQEPRKERKPVTDAADLWLLQAGREQGTGAGTVHAVWDPRRSEGREHRDQRFIFYSGTESDNSATVTRERKSVSSSRIADVAGRWGIHLRRTRLFRWERRRAAAGESEPIGSTYLAKERIFMNSQLMILMET